MSSNSQLQQTDMTPASPVQDPIKMIETFVKELVVDRDFKLDKSGNIVMIRHLHLSKCTAPLLRQICVWFKVSGYKKQSKESTLELLKNLILANHWRTACMMNHRHHVSPQNHHHKKKKQVYPPTLLLALPSMIWKKRSSPVLLGTKLLLCCCQDNLLWALIVITTKVLKTMTI